MIYLIGSLRNPRMPRIAGELRSAGYEVYDDWYAAGPEADDHWKAYEINRGRTFTDAMQGHAARHVFFQDKQYLDRADVGVLVLPAGKSGHLELGYLIGRGTRGYILLDDTVDRWDVMYRFADGVCASVEQFVQLLRREAK
jgi:hypothetical protein